MPRSTHNYREEELKYFTKQQGFMNHASHLIGVVLLGLSLGLISLFIFKWVGNWGWLILALVFVPLFIATHFIVDIIGDKIFK